MLISHQANKACRHPKVSCVEIPCRILVRPVRTVSPCVVDSFPMRTSTFRCAHPVSQRCEMSTDRRGLSTLYATPPQSHSLSGGHRRSSPRPVPGEGNISYPPLGYAVVEGVGQLKFTFPLSGSSSSCQRSAAPPRELCRGSSVSLPFVLRVRGQPSLPAPYRALAHAARRRRGCRAAMP